MSGKRQRSISESLTGKKQHNSSPRRKVALRKRLIELLDQPLRVLETHSGPETMRQLCYPNAELWVGIDKDPKSPNAIHYDSAKVVRAMPLDPFNFYDVDPYGSPWEQIWHIAQRRKVEGRIALAITAGSLGNMIAVKPSIKSAGWSQQMADAIRGSEDKLPRHYVGKRAGLTGRTFVTRFFEAWHLETWIEAMFPGTAAWYFGAILNADAPAGDARG